MLSFDTNILLYAVNQDCRESVAARELLMEHADDTEVVISELVLLELYSLLRNPKVLARPLGAAAAVAQCQIFRENPRWRLVDAAPVMDAVWMIAKGKSFARRRIFDARLAMVLRHHGVTTLATRNVQDFEGFGFARVFNPID